MCLHSSEIQFKHSSQQKGESVRNIKAEQIGKLSVVRGIVTRCTEVKPVMCVATYTCDRCGAEAYQLINSPTFMPLVTCESQDCKSNRHVLNKFSLVVVPFEGYFAWFLKPLVF